MRRGEGRGPCLEEDNETTKERENWSNMLEENRKPKRVFKTEGTAHSVQCCGEAGERRVGFG